MALKVPVPSPRIRSRAVIPTTAVASTPEREVRTGPRELIATAMQVSASES